VVRLQAFENDAVLRWHPQHASMSGRVEEDRIPEKALLKKSLSASETGLVCLGLILLAGLGFGLFEGGRWILRKRAVAKIIPNVLAALRSQQKEIESAINAYKAYYGYYPPSRARTGAPGVNNPLFYELAGTRYDAARKYFYVRTSKEPIPAGPSKNVSISPASRIIFLFPIGPPISSLDGLCLMPNFLPRAK